MARAYYNEFDPFAAAWLRALIGDGLIPSGEVDERSIVDVRPDDLRGFGQCHFFAGIGGWGRALRLAGWSDDRPIWTGSCPCQPFSVAGKGLGEDDPRHLWPHFFRLVQACRPFVVMGEQVAGAAGYRWFDGVASDLEGENYSCRAVDIPACAVGAPHVRQRLYWCAVADAAGWDSITERIQRSGVNGLQQKGRCYRGGSDSAEHASFWSDHEWRTGADGKARRAKPGVRLLAHGIPGRVGRLRGYGNAIVPQVAAEVVAALMDVMDVEHGFDGEESDRG